MNKKKLYESIMRNVAKQVKKALNEDLDSSDDMKAKAVQYFIYGDDGEDYVEDYEDFIEHYNQLLQDGIDLIAHPVQILSFFDYETGEFTTFAEDPDTGKRIPNRLIPAEIREIVNALANDEIDDPYEIMDNYNVIDTLEYTDGVSFNDTWYVLQLSDGRKCIVVDALERDGFYVGLQK